jgi:DNA polymerase I
MTMTTDRPSRRTASATRSATAAAQQLRLNFAAIGAAHGRSLLGAMMAFGLAAIDTVEKETMRALALRGGDYTPEERQQLLDYCQTDVDALAALLPRMVPRVDLPRALLRGRYMGAAARMEWAGIPIDVETLQRIRNGWDTIKSQLIAEIDADYGVYDGQTFKIERWVDFLRAHNIAWPLLESGNLELSDDTFREMSRIHPIVSPIRELRASMSQLRFNELAVGKDGRNRTLLSAFASKTGRNQPSNSKFIFGQSVWLRGLIQPQPGKALAYIDYEQQEFGIAAALSGDPTMRLAYTSGDSYLAFARQAGAVPPNATKQSHKAERERFKVCALSSLYGIGALGLGRRLGESEAVGRRLLEFHHQAYRRYWEWSESTLNVAMLTGKLQTTFGWPVHVGPETKATTLRNFRVQGDGAEILRLACCMVTEAGITVCAPVHDALMIEADIAAIDYETRKTQDLMEEACRASFARLGLVFN